VLIPSSLYVLCENHDMIRFICEHNCMCSIYVYSYFDLQCKEKKNKLNQTPKFTLIMLKIFFFCLHHAFKIFIKLIF